MSNRIIHLNMTDLNIFGGMKCFSGNHKFWIMFDSDIIMNALKDDKNDSICVLCKKPMRNNDDGYVYDENL